jgi:multidrug efflux system membrane fusion protein
MADANVPSTKPDRKVVGKSIGLAIVIGAVLVCLIAIWVYINRPETDDATMRANFIGIAPHASGHIVELLVKDNQFVHEGDLLFTIDPRPYEHAVARAKANLVLTRKEVDALIKALKVADAAIAKANAQVSASTAEIERAEAQSIAAEAAVERAQGEFKRADDHFKRLEPLLAKELTTADAVEAARTERLVAETGVSQAEKALSAAKATVVAAKAQHLAYEAAVEQAKVDRLRAEDNIGREGDFNARIGAAEAQLAEAELDLGYCKVRAPFSGKVVNLNISLGEFARSGAQVFTLVDTRTWYVVANFRETQLKHIQEGAPAEIYLLFKGGKRFRGKVVGPGWAVLPEYGTSTGGLPNVPRNLDWVRLAQRFPVRIEVEKPDDSFRIGASAVVTITGRAPPPQVATSAP